MITGKVLILLHFISDSIHHYFDEHLTSLKYSISLLLLSISAGHTYTSLKIFIKENDVNIFLFLIYS